MKKLFLIFVLIQSLNLWAQDDIVPNSSVVGGGGFAYGFKWGPTIATQNWNGFQRNGLISYHGDIFVESMGSWKQKGGIAQRSSFQAQLGYHRKGSTFRNVFVYDQFNNKIKIPSNLFHNISLGLLGKGAFRLQAKSLAYYGIGVTLNYTVDYQLVGLGTETGVNRFTYGVWFGGGYEWDLGNSPVSFFVEAAINPDIGRQVFIPGGLPSQYRDQDGNIIPTQQQKVNNLIFELSVGFKMNR
jgi:hypothetical protein